MSTTPVFFTVRNFAKFQHYTDRRPPWIKLYRDLWDDPRFFELSESDRYCLISLFILASQHENKVSCSQKWLKAQLLMNRAIPLQTFIDTGWIELVAQDASIPLACKQDASTSPATSYPSRARGETEVQNTEIQKRTFGKFASVRLSDEEHGKLKAKLDGNLDNFIARLDRYSQSSPAKFRKYTSHYAVILNWFDRDVSEGKIKPKTEGPRQFSVHEYL